MTPVEAIAATVPKIQAIMRPELRNRSAFLLCTSREHTHADRKWKWEGCRACYRDVDAALDYLRE